MKRLVISMLLLAFAVSGCVAYPAPYYNGHGHEEGGGNYHGEGGQSHHEGQ